MFRSLILNRSLFRYQFSNFVINEHNFDTFKNTFIQKPQISVFGQYFNIQNALPIFSIITQAKQLQRTQRIVMLNELEAMVENDSSQNSNTDQGLNLLANIHFHKSLQLNKMMNFELVVQELEAAIAIIEIMEYPDYFFLGELQRTKGQAHTRLNQLSKAQKAFIKAENYLKQILDGFIEQQFEQNLSKQSKMRLKGQIGKARVVLAHNLTQLANTYIKQSKIYECKSQIEKSLQIWEQVVNCRGIPFYQLTIRLKCIVHIVFNERIEALQASNQLLTYLEDLNSPKLYQNAFELTMAKLWHMNFIISNFKKDENQNQNTYQILLPIKQKWQKRFIQLVKQCKKVFSKPEYQLIMKSTGLTQEKLSKYGLI